MPPLSVESTGVLDERLGRLGAARRVVLLPLAALLLRGRSDSAVDPASAIANRPTEQWTCIHQRVAITQNGRVRPQSTPNVEGGLRDDCAASGGRGSRVHRATAPLARREPVARHRGGARGLRDGPDGQAGEQRPDGDPGRVPADHAARLGGPTRSSSARPRSRRSARSRPSGSIRAAPIGWRRSTSARTSCPRTRTPRPSGEASPAPTTKRKAEPAVSSRTWRGLPGRAKVTPWSGNARLSPPPS
jgi:hypothetical protein